MIRDVMSALRDDLGCLAYVALFAGCLAVPAVSVVGIAWLCAAVSPWFLALMVLVLAEVFAVPVVFDVLAERWGL